MLLHKGNTHIHRFQRKGVVYLKQHKTVRILHLFRQYSALTVVVSSAFLVTGTNIATHEQPGSMLSGYFHTENADTQQFPMKSPAKRESLSSAPLAFASNTVDTEAKLEDPSEIDAPSNTIIASSDLAPVIQEDPEEGEGVKIYTIQEGDTLGKIAQDHNITINTILWANDISNIDEIRPGDQIFILPIAGLKYIVKEGDTIQDIAKTYHGDTERIIAFNNLPANGRLETNQELIIPDGYKDTPKPASDSLLDRRQYATSSGGAATDISGWRTLSGKAGTGHTFPYGYCTWYVAQKRYVPWGGNAGTWLYNAKALGYKTGKSPRVGSIVVTTENRYYGHVALVEKVLDDSIIVSEMNYVGWGKTDRRTISLSNRSIKGYVY
ncbi:MAG: LysM peptidoglycan-binding domain-containing protein [Candidatus Moraniibacteriota bacterium]